MVKKLFLFLFIAFLSVAVMPSSRSVDELDRLVAQAVDEMSTLKIDPQALDLSVDPRVVPNRPLRDEQLALPPKYRSI